MDKKDFEELKKRIENAEFNNYEEDERMTRERYQEIKKKKEEIPSSYGSDKKKNYIIGILCACVIILLIIVFIFLLSGNKKDDDNTSNNTNSSNSQKENKEQEEKGKDNTEKDDNTIDDKDYDYSIAKVFFNKYVLVPANDDKEEVITDLDGNILLKTSTYWKVFEGPENSIYIVDLNYSKDGNYMIKRIKDNLVHEVFKEKADGLLIGNEKGNLIGIYKKETKNDIYYIFNGNDYDTVTLESYGAFESNNSAKENKFIYNGRYVITYEASNSEDFNNYGIYDLKTKKQIINGSYDQIEYLHDNIFVAIKDKKTGIINTDNKVLLDLKNELVSYSNGLYFVGNNNKLQVFDKDLKDLNVEIDVPNLSKFTYSPCCGAINPFDLEAYKDYVIVRIGYLPGATSDYIAVDKKGNKTNLGKGYMGIINEYLVMSNDEDTYINMYDSSLTVKHKIDVSEKAIKLDKLNIFLNNSLVINRNKLYNLTTNTNKGTTSWYRRTAQEFDVRIDFEGEKGTITVSSNDEVIQKLEDVSVNEFLKADNNGITVTKNYFIYNAGGVIIIKRTAE